MPIDSSDPLDELDEVQPAPPMIDAEFVARTAFDQARQALERGGPDGSPNGRLPEHMIGMARVFVPLGKGYLQSVTGFDPDTYAQPLAVVALTSYVRCRLLGMPPEADAAIAAAIEEWRQAAAKIDGEFEILADWDLDVMAAIAVREALRGGEKVPSADDITQARVYIETAAEAMEEEVGHDPSVVAPVLGEQAAIHYARARLRGSRAETDEAYVAAFEKWRRSAARASEAFTAPETLVDADTGIAVYVRDVNNLAKMALTAALRGSRNGAIKQDAAEAAVYIRMALSHLRSTSTYDPDVHAPALADMAAIEYARVTLLGAHAGTSAGYNETASEWRREAAIQHHKGFTDEYPATADDARYGNRRMRTPRYSRWRVRGGYTGDTP